MTLLRELVADYLALPEVRFALKWWWLLVGVVALATAAVWFQGRR